MTQININVIGQKENGFINLQRKVYRFIWIDPKSFMFIVDVKPFGLEETGPLVDHILSLHYRRSGNHYYLIKCSDKIALVYKYDLQQIR